MFFLQVDIGLCVERGGEEVFTVVFGVAGTACQLDSQDEPSTVLQYLHVLPRYVSIHLYTHT